MVDILLSYLSLEGLTQLDLLRLAALAAKWDTPPKDALDTLVLKCPLWWEEVEQVCIGLCVCVWFWVG